MRGTFYGKPSGETDSCARFETRAHIQSDCLVSRADLALYRSVLKFRSRFCEERISSRNDVIDALSLRRARARTRCRDAKTIDPDEITGDEEETRRKT